MVLLEGKKAVSSPAMIQDSFFVGIYSINWRTAGDETTLLMSIMAMASRGRKGFFTSFVLFAWGKGF
jgi:hypothetical protein